MSDEAKIPTSEELLALADEWMAARGYLDERRIGQRMVKAICALAAPKPTEPTREAEPVAWMYEQGGHSDVFFYCMQDDERHDPDNGWTETPLYDAPALAAARAEGERAMREAALSAQPSTAENPNENSYQRGRFDGVMDYGRALAALPVPDPPRDPAEEVEAAVLAEREACAQAADDCADFHEAWRQNHDPIEAGRYCLEERCKRDGARNAANAIRARTAQAKEGR